MNGDGRDDIVFARGNQLGIWHQSEVQNGDAQAGNGAEAVEYTETLIDVVVDDAITALHVDDVDGDGDFDILIGTQSGVRLIHSNFSQLNQSSHRFMHVWTRRGSKPPAPTDEEPNRWPRISPVMDLAQRYSCGLILHKRSRITVIR